MKREMWGDEEGDVGGVKREIWGKREMWGDEEGDVGGVKREI